MANRRSKSTDNQSQTPVLRESIEQAKAQLQDRIEKGRSITSLPITDRGELDRARAQYYTWDEFNEALLRRLFITSELAQQYSYWGITVVGITPSSLSEDINEFHENISQKIRRLESILERLPLYISESNENSSDTSVKAPKQTNYSATRPSVFLVHGHNQQFKETVARFLSQLELTPIILHEQPSGGRTVIEKVEDHSEAGFAVVILTPDDVGRLAEDSESELQSRARQNVIFEWGFFVAKLGRRRVCALYAEGVELPSDVNGVIYVELDTKGAWKLLLARELKAAQIDVDLNRAI